MEIYDDFSFRKYTKWSEIDKSIHTLEGILKGISLDNKLNDLEINELVNWSEKHRDLSDIHPYNELIPLIDKYLEDNELTEEEIKDILWFCNNLKTANRYYDFVTSDIQRLQGIMHGIMCDNKITDDEINELKVWLNKSNHLAGCYPYDELNSILTTILKDSVITDEERNYLKVFFSEFIDIKTTPNIDEEELANLKKEFSIQGICSISPKITFEGKQFCFTGVSCKASRKQIANIITALNGKFMNSVSKKTDYLIIGNDGNPCWAFSCYGRKVETAVNLRKNGSKVIIVNENDFWSTIENYNV
ncbi:BRCA1 C Terminus (BRCT) domain-containing protein [Clostridium sp. USBA 49]|uniref:BRCT domain-containing protein n=1 Tax=Clostridium sp. USBA 49 TaxID=1881060 RepID=UPI00099A9415|nr:BRCT domain-containing protein [Clostridium sp. USBA 49]SKA89492.1 BRCA1 C Terminus (BRCT) domain-containing protein [Clostridium sp. USBA 49]